MKRTPLKPGKPLERRAALDRGKPLTSRSKPSETRTSAPKRAISPASHPQRMKVRAEGKCRRCSMPESVLAIHPAHVTDRSLGGCSEPDCIVPLCFICHRAYDEGEADLLPILSLAEQAHAVLHLGIARAAKRITNDRDPLL